MTQSVLPQQKAKRTFTRLLWFSVILIITGSLALWWSPLMIVAALASILLHRGLEWVSAFEEQQRNSLFVHPSQGLRVLAIVPNSPAQELGIIPGETLLRVNGVMVHSVEQLHSSLRMNAAFCKLEVQNLSGESKYLQRPMYAGDHHQLGVILSPEQSITHVASWRFASIYQIIGMKLNTLTRSRVRRDSLELEASSPAAALAVAEVAATSDTKMDDDEDDDVVIKYPWDR
ncbi:PDZ domain-containing protein [Paenibacillus sp. CMAA1364]